MSAEEAINSYEVDSHQANEEQSRRFACDRCRGQKLRCERRCSTENRSCKRCLKARVRCVTSPPRRMGRPRQDTIARRPTISDPIHEFDVLLNTKNAAGAVNNSFNLHAVTAPVESSSVTPVRGLDHDTEKNRELEQTYTPIDFSFDLQQMLVDSPTLTGYQDYLHGNDLSPIPSSEDIKDDCLQKLFRLQSDLFKQLGRIQSGEIESCLSLSPSPTNSTSKVAGTASNLHGVQDPKFPIGRMLDNSQEFLRILKEFLRSYSGQSSSISRCSSTDSSCSDYDRERTSTTYNDLCSNHSMNDASSSSASRTISYGHSSSHSLPPYSEFTPLINDSTNKAGFLRLDFPSILAILSCYICLVRIHRVVFTQIHRLLLAFPAMHIEPRPIFPSLELGGFHLEGNRDLQIKIFLQVSGDMLDRIDTAVRMLAGRSNHVRSGNSAYEEPAFTSLLDTILKQEAIETIESDQAGIMSLRTVMRGIKRLLRSSTSL